MDRGRARRPRAGVSSAPRRHPLEDDPLTNPANDESAEQISAPGRPPWLLLLGAAIGLGIATFGLLETRAEARRLSADAAARVGERTIRRVDYERVLAGVQSDRRGGIDEALRRRVLDRMIDEELLVQRAVELGLASIDRRVRGELTSALMDSIVSEADAGEPSAEEITRHFEENIDFFSRPGRLRGRAIFFSPRGDRPEPDGKAADRAARAVGALRAGDDPDSVERGLGDRQVSPLPNALLPPGKVRDYVGPTLLQTLEALEVGAWSDPVETGGGFYVMGLVEREPRIVPRVEEVEAVVRQNLKRTRGDQALRRYLDDLRDRASVTINEAVFVEVLDGSLEG